MVIFYFVQLQASISEPIMHSLNLSYANLDYDNIIISPHESRCKSSINLNKYML